VFKTILVPVRGDGGDKVSLGTAFAVATLFDGHIDVVHIKKHAAAPCAGDGFKRNAIDVRT
jgi:hypothetical protein